MSEIVFVKVAQEGPDVAAEARASFAAADKALAKHGLSLKNVFKTRLHYTTRQVWADLYHVREPLYAATFLDGGFPASTGLITGGRGGASPVLEIELTAAAGKSVLDDENVAHVFGGRTTSFSHLGEANGIAFLTGQSAFDAKGNITVSSFAEEAEQTLVSIEAVLKKSGRSIADIVSLGVFLGPPAAAAYAEVRAAIDRFIQRGGGQPPAIACVGIEGLVWEGMSIEIDTVAGPAGAPHRASQAAVAPSALGPLPRSAPAIQAGSIVTATATGDDLGSALALIRKSLDGVDGVRGSHLVTVWATRPWPQNIETAVHKVLPGATVSVGHMVNPAGTPAVTIELVGNSAAA